MKRFLLSFFLLFPLTFLSAQKNILFISVDDLKPMFKSYGHQDMITPNIDALAAKGTSFLILLPNKLFVLHPGQVFSLVYTLIIQEYGI